MSRHHTSPSRSLFAAGLVALAACVTTVPALAQDDGRDLMAVNATSDFYRQQAIQGTRQHGFSPAQPPRNGRFIYGHWTPYDMPPPGSLPDGAQTHVIAQGDTLWDIAATYYQDPLLWPYVWEANSWVTYPHWIYPGDVLWIPPLMVLPGGELEGTGFASLSQDFVPVGLIDDLYCGHFIAPPNRRFFGEIVGEEEDPTGIMMAQDAVVYVNVGAKDGVLPGDEFAIIYPRLHFDVSAAERELMTRQLEHPRTDEKLGHVMAMAGRLKIILLGEDVSTARITYACNAIERGYDIYPFTEVPIPLRPVTRERELYFNELPEKGRGFVVWGADRTFTWRERLLVSIDLGSDHGVLPGDVFRVYREHPYRFTDIGVDHLGSWFDKRAAVEGMRAERDPVQKTWFGRQQPLYDLPPRIIGELVVLYTERETATAKLIWTEKEVLPGDRIVYKPVRTGLSDVVSFSSTGSYTPGVPFSRQAPAEPVYEGKDAHGDF